MGKEGASKAAVDALAGIVKNEEKKQGMVSDCDSTCNKQRMNKISELITKTTGKNVSAVEANAYVRNGLKSDVADLITSNYQKNATEMGREIKYRIKEINGKEPTQVEIDEVIEEATALQVKKGLTVSKCTK